jgi:hypothetical protein
MLRRRLSKMPAGLRQTAPPEQLFHRPALEHLPDDGAAAARRVRRKFRGDQQAWEIFAHSILFKFCAAAASTGHPPDIHSVRDPVPADGFKTALFHQATERGQRQGFFTHVGMNPGGLKATSMRHPKTEQGYRIFSSFLDGMQALLFDIDLKLSGKSWAKLTPTSTLEDLALAYTLPVTTAAAWAKWLRQALHTEQINQKTPLAYFTEDKNV